MTATETPVLELEEPLEVLAVLRALAADRPAVARARAPRALASYAFEQWREALGPLGIDGGLLLQAFERGKREIWLWVTGDRRWSQLAPSLAARVARRAS